MPTNRRGSAGSGVQLVRVGFLGRGTLPSAHHSTSVQEGTRDRTHDLTGAAASKAAPGGGLTRIASRYGSSCSPEPWPANLPPDLSHPDLEADRHRCTPQPDQAAASRYWAGRARRIKSASPTAKSKHLKRHADHDG